MSPYVELRGAYTWTLALDSATHSRLLRRPENLWSLSGRITPIPRLTIAPEILFVGRSPDYVYDNLGQFSQATQVKGGTTANLVVSYRVQERISVFMEARNLGNIRYEPTSGYVIPGTTILFGTRFTL